MLLSCYCLLLSYMFLVLIWDYSCYYRCRYIYTYCLQWWSYYLELVNYSCSCIIYRYFLLFYSFNTNKSYYVYTYKVFCYVSFILLPYNYIFNLLFSLYKSYIVCFCSYSCRLYVNIYVDSV